MMFPLFLACFFLLGTHARQSIVRADGRTSEDYGQGVTGGIRAVIASNTSRSQMGWGKLCCCRWANGPCEGGPVPESDLRYFYTTKPDRFAHVKCCKIDEISCGPEKEYETLPDFTKCALHPMYRPECPDNSHPVDEYPFCECTYKGYLDYDGLENQITGECDGPPPPAPSEPPCRDDCPWGTKSTSRGECYCDGVDCPIGAELMDEWRERLYYVEMSDSSSRWTAQDYLDLPLLPDGAPDRDPSMTTKTVCRCASSVETMDSSHNRQLVPWNFAEAAWEDPEFCLPNPFPTTKFDHLNGPVAIYKCLDGMIGQVAYSHLQWIVGGGQPCVCPLGYTEQYSVVEQYYGIPRPPEIIGCRPQEYYVFVDQFPMKNSLGIAWHSEIRFCNVIQFTQEKQRRWDDKLSRGKQHLKAHHWKDLGKEVECVVAYFGSVPDEEAPGSGIFIHTHMTMNEEVSLLGLAQQVTKLAHPEASVTVQPKLSRYLYARVSGIDPVSTIRSVAKCPRKGDGKMFRGIDYGNGVLYNCNVFTATVLKCRLQKTGRLPGVIFGNWISKLGRVDCRCEREMSEEEQDDALDVDDFEDWGSVDFEMLKFQEEE